MHSMSVGILPSVLHRRQNSKRIAATHRMGCGGSKEVEQASPSPAAEHVKLASPSPNELPASVDPTAAAAAPAPSWAPVAAPAPAPAQDEGAPLDVQAALTILEADFALLTAQSSAAEAALSDAGNLLPLSLRGELAQLHGIASGFVGRLDALILGDLEPAVRDEARARRRAMLAACDALIDTTERQIKLIDQRRESPRATANAQGDELLEDTATTAATATAVGLDVG